jgi:hypothetical protein
MVWWLLTVKGDVMEKVVTALKMIVKLWGKEIFGFLRAQAAKTETSIDDYAVDKLEEWLS